MDEDSKQWSFLALQTKVPNKQDDAWIMTRLIKQLTDMGFPVSVKHASLNSF